MTGRHVVVFGSVVGMLAGAASPCGGQAANLLPMGQRVRVSVTSGPDALIGTLLEQRADTLWIGSTDGRRTAVRTPAIVRFEESKGRSAVAGARSGALVAGGVGALILAMGSGGSVDGDIWQVPAAIAFYAAIGAGIGALRSPEQWEALPLPEPLNQPVADQTAVTTPTPASGTPRAAPDATMPHSSTALRRGETVRFTGPDSQPVSGIVLAATRDSLLLDRGGVPTRWALADVQPMYRYLGETAGAGMRRAGVVGAVVGMVFGGMVGFGFSQFNPEPSAGTVTVATLGVGALGALAGYALFAPFGAALPADEWRRVPFP